MVGAHRRRWGDEGRESVELRLHGNCAIEYRGEYTSRVEPHWHGKYAVIKQEKEEGEALEL
jgi:hypothetical protein